MALDAGLKSTPRPHHLLPEPPWERAHHLQLPNLQGVSRSQHLLYSFVTKKAEEEGTLVGVIFERGHGSAWGNQFYMEVCEDEIIQANYISEDSADLVTEEHIAITSEQWQEICDAIEKMELKKVRSSAWKEQLGADILDGGAYHELSLIWKTEKGEKSVAYHWPEDEAGAALEQLLEQLLERETLSGSEQVEEEEIDPDTIIEVEEETEDIDITFFSNKVFFKLRYICMVRPLRMTVLLLSLHLLPH